MLARLPALCAIGAPSPASYLRLVPQRWAGAFQCWGRENREAGLRLVTGTHGSEATAANAELKCFDASANPYLVVGAVTAVICAAVSQGAALPPEVTVDPASLPGRRRPSRLPETLNQAIAAAEHDDVLRAAMGDVLFEAFMAVRRAEVARFKGVSDDDVAAATRWIY